MTAGTDGDRYVLTMVIRVRLAYRRDDQVGYLSRRGGLTRIAIRYVPRIGHVDCYALRRSKFGRSDKETDPNQLHAVTGHD